MANDQIQSISIGLGLNVAQLETDARAAKQRLDEILPKKQERLLTLKPKVDNAAAEGILAQIERVRLAAQQKLNAKPFMLTPRFSVTKSATTDMRKSIEANLGQTPIRIPITVGKINKRQLQKDISDAIGVVPVALSWKWDKNGAPPREFEAVVHLRYEDGGGPPMGGRGRPGPGPGGGGGPTPGPETGPARPSRAERSAANKAEWAQRDRTGGPQAEGKTREERSAKNKAEHAARQQAAAEDKQTRAERSAANKAAHAAQQEAANAARKAAKTASAAAGPTTGPAPAAPAAGPAAGPPPPPRTSGPMAAGAPPPRPPRGSTPPPRAAGGGAGAAAGGRARVSPDELRRTPDAPVYSPWDLMAQEAEKANGTFAQAPSTRGARTGSRAAGFATPATAAAINKPLSPAVLAQREAAWKHHLQLIQHFEQVTAVNARSSDPAHQRARAIVQAMKSVRRDPATGEFDTTEMDKLMRSRFSESGGKLTEAYGNYLSGNFQQAREGVGKTFKDFGIESGLRKGGRRLGKSLNPARPSFNKQPADIQLFGELGQSIRAESAIAQNPDAVLKNRSVRTRGFGPTSYTGNVQTKTQFETDEGREKFEEQLRKNVPYVPGVRAEGESEAEFRRRVAQEEPSEEYLARNKEGETTGRIWDEDRGVYVYVSEHDARAKAKAQYTKTHPSARERSERKAAQSRAGKHREAPSPVPGFEPGPLGTAQAETFTSTPTPEGFAGAQRRSRPTQNMGGGPTPRMTDENRQADEYIRNFWNNFARTHGGAGAGFATGGSRKGRQGQNVALTRADKLKAMALGGTEFGERANALSFLQQLGHEGVLSANDKLKLQELGHTVTFTAEDKRALRNQGHDIEGLAEGGRVRGAMAYLFGEGPRRRGRSDIDVMPRLGGSYGEPGHGMDELEIGKSYAESAHKWSRSHMGYDEFMESLADEPDRRGIREKLFGRADGGNIFSRPFGASAGGPKVENVAKTNSYAWKKLRAQQIRRQPYCAFCGIGRSEARFRGISLTADHIQSQAEGGDPWDINNLQTLCSIHNSAKAHMSMAIDNHSRPRKWSRKAAIEGKAGGGLIERLAGVYKVNERGEEGYESKSGRYDQLLGEKQRLFAPPEDGKIIPHHKVPEWLRRAQEKQAKFGYVAEKEMGRADGGLVFHGSRGQRISEATARRQGWVKGVGEISRVFVVNLHEITAALRSGGTRPPTGAEPDEGAPTGDTGPSRARTKTKTGKTMPKAKAGGMKPLGAERRADLDIESQEMFDQMRAEIGDIRADVAEQLQLTPVRALSVSVGQIFQTAFGGRGGILRRARIANRLAEQATTRVAKAQAARTKRDELREQVETMEALPPDEVDPEALKGARSALADQDKAFKKRNKAAKVRKLEADIAGRGEREVLKNIQQDLKDEFITPEQAEKRTARVQATAEMMRRPKGEGGMGISTGGVATRTNRLQAQALGVVGIVGGTIAFTAAMQLAQLGLELIGKVATDAADQVTGFAMTTAKVTKELAEAIQQMPGHPEAAIAQRFGMLGISPEQAGALGPVGRQATIMAGAQNLLAVRDMQRAADFSRQAGGAIPGLGVGFGNGLFPGTIFSGINQTQGVAQLVGSRLRDIIGPEPSLTAPFAPGVGGGGFPVIGGGGMPFTIPMSALGGGPVPATTATQGPAQAYLQEELATAKQALGLQGAGLKLIEKNTETGQDLLDANREAFKAAGADAEELQKLMERSGLVLQGPGGRGPDVNTVNLLLEGISRGHLIPNAEELFEAARPQIAAQFAAIRQSAERAREETIPTNIAMRLRTQPQLAPGTGLVGGAVAQPTFGPATNPFAALGQNAVANIDSVTAAVGRAQAISQEAAAAGEEWLDGLSAEGKAAVQAISDLGTEIANISTIQANMQAQNQGEQMNRQMELQIRQFGDVLGLAGKVGQTVRATVGYDDQGNKILGDIYVKRTLMGKLQRDQMMLSREDTRVQLNQQQRQINFGLALARIGVPGESPAERAANLAYNKQVAQEQQEAHDRAEDMFEISKQIADEGIRLNVEDASKELQQLSQSDALTLKLQGFDQVRQNLQEAQNDLKPIADSFIETMRAESKAVEDAMIGAMALQPEFAEMFETSINNHMEYLRTNYADILGLIDGTTTPAAPTAPEPTDYPIRRDPGHVGEPIPPGYASGKWNTGNEFARLHAGEMVLPANLASAVRANGGATMYGGNGGGTTVIQINNPIVRDDSDIDKIARQVEQVMNRRAAAVGLAN